MKGLRKAFSNRCMPSSAPPMHEGLGKSETVTALEPIITKWSIDASSYATMTPLFHHSREEVRLFITAISQLNSHMHVAVEDHAARRDLAYAHRLMQIAMKRMQKEFSLILSVNRDLLDSDSIHSTVSTLTSVSDSDYDESNHRVSPDEEIKYVGESLGGANEAHSGAVMADMKTIAECMVTSGYTKECTNIYKNIRKSIVQEGIYRLGFQRNNQSNLQNLDWEATVETWLAASRIAIKSIFSGERALCDYVFGTSSPHIRELCFAEITRDAAVQFLHYPELIASVKTTASAKSKLPEATCHILDLYCTISDLLPDIESVFFYDSASAVRSQALSSLKKLVDSIRTALSDLESTVQNATSKGVARGGGLHPLTRDTMDYLVMLSEYNTALVSIFAGHPHPATPAGMEPSIATRLEWLLLVLVCKIDAKAEVYKNASLSYIFLANNHQYIVSKVRESNLVRLLGDKWVARQDEKVWSFITGYENVAWAKVMAALEEENVTKFNSAFRDAWRQQGKWALVDEGGLRAKIVASVKRKVMIPYLELCLKRTDGEKQKDEESGEDVIRFLPEDVEEYMEGIFRGSASGESSGSGLDSASSILSAFRSSGSGFWRS